MSEKLIAEYGYWGSHPKYPLADWQREVNENNTRLGYWDWVEAEINDNIDDEAAA